MQNVIKLTGSRSFLKRCPTLQFTKNQWQVNRVAQFSTAQTAGDAGETNEEEMRLARYKRKLLYQSKQRGMKENCILVGGFAEKYLSTMNTSELAQFDKLLQEIDPALNEWICGVHPFPPDLDGTVAQNMKTFANNNPLNYTFVPPKE
mmetsp:Transcript_126137/g.188236  ORF Transcript_126137/g.188236 Transcript_126137/m.188236 type:complete len:148 (+) Transcript_126137:1-444(+)